MGILKRGLVLSLALAAPLAWSQAPAAHLSRESAIQPEAWRLVLLANRERNDKGVPPLWWDPALAEAARQHCLRMAAEGPISHRYGGEPDVSARAGEAGAHFSLIEENVAFGASPAAIHDGWMNSPGHRDNLLNPQVDRVGIAVVASHGLLYAVADYTKAVKVLTREQVEAAVGGVLRARGMMVLPETLDARAYCGHSEGARGLALSSEPEFRMLWQDADVTELPQPLIDRLATGRFRKATVGSCPSQDVKGQFTLYRVAVLLY